MRRYLPPLLSVLTLLLAACAPVVAAPAEVLVADAPRDAAAAPADAAATPDVLPAEGAVEAQLPALPPATCPVTTRPSPAFTPPGVSATYPGQFWYGTAALWTDLRSNGTWAELPHDATGYGQKLFFDREGYDWQAEPEPALTVSGRRLDADAAPLAVLPPTNGHQADVGSFMLAGGNFPTAGCWEVTAQYAADTLTYVVWIAP
jgi:hypothetical protein